jgi:hypothetical protein
LTFRQSIRQPGGGGECWWFSNAGKKHGDMRYGYAGDITGLASEFSSEEMVVVLLMVVKGGWMHLRETGQNRECSAWLRPTNNPLLLSSP